MTFLKWIALALVLLGVVVVIQLAQIWTQIFRLRGEARDARNELYRLRRTHFPDNLG